MNAIQFVGEHTSSFEVRQHRHSSWEFVYCTSGQGCFEFEDGTRIPYQEGDAVAVPPNLLHSNATDSGFSNIHVWILEPSFPYKTPFRVSDDTSRHLQLNFQQAKYYYLSDIMSCELVLSALGELISNYMEVYRSNAEFSEAVKQIRSKILLCYSECDFALDEFIRSLPFHYDYLRKLFKKEVGLTPLEYMTQLRMKRACVLLTMQGAENYSISEIAQLCGFDDPLYFSRVFKKKYGVSPSAFAGR